MLSHWKTILLSQQDANHMEIYLVVTTRYYIIAFLAARLTRPCVIPSSRYYIIAFFGRTTPLESSRLQKRKKNDRDCNQRKLITLCNIRFFRRAGCAIILMSPLLGPRMLYPPVFFWSFFIGFLFHRSLHDEHIVLF